MTSEQKIELVPLWHRLVLTLEEATAYSGLGRNKLMQLADEPGCDFIIWRGRKRLYKREKLDEFINDAYIL